MKSIRLNKDLREEIKSNIEQAYCIKNKEPVVKDPWEALKEATLTVYCKRAKVLQGKADKVELGKYLKTTNYLYIDLPEQSSSVYFRDSNDNQEYLPSLNPASSYFLTEEICKTDPELNDLLKKYKSDRKKERPQRVKRSEWLKGKANYMADVSNVLIGVNTTGQLLEVWPEVEKFLPKGITDPSKIGLPSVNINQLNKLI